VALTRFDYATTKTWLLHVATAVTVFFMPPVWILVAIVFYWAASSTFQLIFHDWICHEYCRPRNIWIECAMLMLFYAHDNNVRNKKNYHVFHHRQWHHPDRDPTYRKLQGVSLGRYIMGLHNRLDLGIPNKEFSLLERSNLVRWLDPHSRWLYCAWIVGCALVLPWTWFVVVCVWYPWLLHVALCYHDWHLHGPQRRPDRDWMSLLFAHGAWHHAHHESWRQEHYGPGVWRWINPAWYVRHLLFTKSPTPVV
jgi:hypothetical protein